MLNGRALLIAEILHSNSTLKEIFNFYCYWVFFLLYSDVSFLALEVIQLSKRSYTINTLTNRKCLNQTVNVYIRLATILIAIDKGIDRQVIQNEAQIFIKSNFV